MSVLLLLIVYLAVLIIWLTVFITVHFIPHITDKRELSNEKYKKLRKDMLFWPVKVWKKSFME
jgi:Na+/proline symporter